MKNRPETTNSFDGSDRGQRLWSGIEELSNDPTFEAWVNAEYPVAAEFTPTARREFLKLMGASFALAGLTGCEKSPFVDALPYVDQPQNVSIGQPKYYATAVTFEGYAQPVIATTHSGRPTKLDGNPDHPVTRGRSDIFMQAAVLGLYDPDRAQGPTRHGEQVSWDDVSNHMVEMRRAWSRDHGAGLRLLLSPTTSPTFRRQLDDLLREYPNAKVHRHEAVGTHARRSSMAAAYGQPLDLHYKIDECDVVVSFDEDFLGPGVDQVRNARLWSEARGRGADKPGIVLHMAESVPTITGAMAKDRLPADASRLPILAQAFAKAVGVSGATDLGLDAKEAAWIKRAVAACHDAKGGALAMAGATSHSTTAGWIARANAALGTRGLQMTAPVEAVANAGTLEELIAAIKGEQVVTLIVVDTNPVYASRGALGIGEALRTVPHSLHLGLHRDETAEYCEWQLPLTHDLETWSDARATDGTVTIIQPVIASFYDVRTVHQIMAMLGGQIGPDAEAIVRETWRDRFSDNFEARWRQALRDGWIPETAALPINVDVIGNSAMSSETNEVGDLDIVFRPDPTIWDGQFANNGWLQELPKPLTTLTWGNIIAIAPALADRLGAINGDHVEVTIRNRSVTGPVWIMPGQAANTVALYLGYGRQRAGRVGNALGYNAYDVRPADQPWLTKGTLQKLESKEALAVTQLHHRMEGFDFVREVSPEQQLSKTDSSQPSLYPTKEPAQNAWAMVIDLDVCIGCNACVVACTAENNVPVVGKDQVTIGREMHWLRIARYYSGDVHSPRSFFQPVPCMHCEDAPCEMGCPVHATTHSPEGVNQMVYNRCIGTRTCSSYCPYKVRRFNFYDYRTPPRSPTHAAHNPDVTVRSRGVMEKCTYCTQRIEAAHVAADKENRQIRDGEVVTACQSACPTNAITFGNINDPNSKVSRLRGSGRHYVLLEELGTRPRTTYLARWKDTPEDQQG